MPIPTTASEYSGRHARAPAGCLPGRVRWQLVRCEASAGTALQKSHSPAVRHSDSSPQLLTPARKCLSACRRTKTTCAAHVYKLRLANRLRLTGTRCHGAMPHLRWSACLRLDLDFSAARRALSAASRDVTASSAGGRFATCACGLRGASSRGTSIQCGRSRPGIGCCSSSRACAQHRTLIVQSGRGCSTCYYVACRRLPLFSGGCRGTAAEAAPHDTHLLRELLSAGQGLLGQPSHLVAKRARSCRQAVPHAAGLHPGQRCCLMTGTRATALWLPPSGATPSATGFVWTECEGVGRT